MAGVDRGVSTVVGYVLNLGIATVLITGLLISGTSVVTDQQERTVRAELDVIGNRLAADLETADRLLRTGEGEVTIRTSLPQTVAGSDYRVTVRASDTTVTLALETTDPTISRTIPIKNTSKVKTGTVEGGDLVITGASGTLEVTDG